MPNATRGFSLLEVLIASALTLIVVGAAFTLLSDSQGAFRRENEVAELQSSTRAGLDAIQRDVEVAGYRTPSAAAVLWASAPSGPDELTLVYADTDTPIGRPSPCHAARGFGDECESLHRTSHFLVELYRLEPLPADPESVFDRGENLVAVERSDCNEDGKVGILVLRLTDRPKLTDETPRPQLGFAHDQGRGSQASRFPMPEGFNSLVMSNCAAIGRFHVVSYRVVVSETGQPNLERRDWVHDDGWSRVANNIEDLQITYGIGASADSFDVPSFVPHPSAPDSWINRVEIQITGRSAAENLPGATARFEGDEPRLRRTLSSSVGLRNVTQAMEEANSGTPDWRR